MAFPQTGEYLREGELNLGGWCTLIHTLFSFIYTEKILKIIFFLK